MDQDAIESKCERANQLIDENDFKGALKELKDAWNLVDEPKDNFYESTWIKATEGDIHFMIEDYQEALNAFSFALNSERGFSNPFINLRLGQCYYKLNDLDQAKEYLKRAYMIDEEKIFKREDAVYLKLAKED